MTIDGTFFCLTCFWHRKKVWLAAVARLLGSHFSTTFKQESVQNRHKTPEAIQKKKKKKKTKQQATK